MAFTPCKRCRVRFPQFRGYCLTCVGEMGGRNAVERMVALQQAQIRQQRRPAIAPPPPPARPNPIRVIDGQEFEVMWDGSVR